MPNREQLTHERVMALIRVLKSEGILTEDEARWLQSNREFGEAPELARGLRERREGRDDE